MLSSIGLGFLFLLNRTAILPSRFLGDEATIQSLAQQVWESPTDSSYTSVATAYRFIGVAQEPLLAALFGFLVGCIPYFLVLRAARGRFLGRLSAPLLMCGILLTAVYMGTFSKEVFIAPIVSLVVILKPHWSRTLLLVGLICVYAYLFRSYWFFLAASVVVLLASKKIFKGWKGTITVAPALVIAGTLLIVIAMGVPGDFYRSSVNIYREASGDVNTLIPRYLILPEPFGAVGNNLLSFVILQFPIPLLLKLSPYYMLISVFIGALWITYYRAVISLAPVAQVDDEYSRLTRASVILLGFLVTQSFFEPDFGSALKHLTPLVPLLLWIYLQARIRISCSNELQKDCN